MYKLYIHKEGEKSSQIVEGSESISVKELMEKIVDIKKDPSSKLEELVVCLEDKDESIDIMMTLKEAKIEHKHHIHCHRCKHIDATITYVTGNKHDFKVRPGITVSELIKRAAHHFHVDSKVIPTLIMKDENGETLDE